MKNLGAPDFKDWFIFGLIIIQAYWSYKQFRNTEDAGRII
jgi:hypothetical protein